MERSRREVEGGRKGGRQGRKEKGEKGGKRKEV
jgi:hypothetical protein